MIPRGTFHPMNGISQSDPKHAVEAIYRTQSRRVLATLIRLLGDFELAEEALHDAFMAAVEKWPWMASQIIPRRG